MIFVKKFTPPDFQAKNFTPSISPNFNSFSDKNTKKMSENGEIYTAGKNFHYRRQWRHWQIPPLLGGGGQILKQLRMIDLVNIDI